MRLVRLSPTQHDAHAALVSHLPHALAAILVRLAADNKALNIASTGFRDATRIAAGDAAVWRDVFSTNRQAVAQAIDLLIRDLSHFRATLTAGEDAELQRFLEESRALRERWLHDSLGEEVP
jgi:prephenate dehydrogenase